MAGGLFLLLAAALLAPAAAQQAPAASGAVGVLRGHAVDASGKAVAGLSVSLHRVDASGGARVASAVSDSAGNFRFELTEPPGNGVLFAAARYQGELYVGPPIEGSLPTGTYELVVGSPATSARALMGGAAAGAAGGPAAPTASPAASQRRAVWFWTALVGVVVVAAAALLALRTRRPAPVPQGRRLLMELALVEERLDALDGAAGAASAERRHWTRLRERLRRALLAAEAGAEPVDVDAAG